MERHVSSTRAERSTMCKENYLCSLVLRVDAGHITVQLTPTGDHVRRQPVLPYALHQQHARDEHTRGLRTGHNRPSDASHRRLRVPRAIRR